MQIVLLSPKPLVSNLLLLLSAAITIVFASSRGMAQGEERLAQELREAVARGRAELSTALYTNEVAADPTRLEATQVLRALLASGSGANDPEIAPLLRKVAESPPGDDPEILAAQVRLIAASGPRTFRTELAQRLTRLAELVLEDGGYQTPRDPDDDERPCRDTLTAHVLLAFRDARQAGMPIPEKVAREALGFLLEQRSRDGSFGHLGRRARSHGRATAAALAVLIWARTDECFGELHAKIDEALMPAWFWLQREFTPDRNPGTPLQMFAWHEDVAFLLSLGALPLVDRGTTREVLERFLASYDLPEGGWNKEASLQDVMRPPIPEGKRVGGAPVGVPIARVQADVMDTARAVLAISERSAGSSEEWSIALGTLFSDPRLLPRDREEQLALGRFLVEHARRTAPVLIRALNSPERYVRQLAIHVLEEIAGEDFGYSAGRRVEDNEEALERWQRWWFEKGRFL